MRRVIRDAMKEHLRKPSIPPQLMIGTGGTFTTLAQIDLRRPGGTSASPDPVSTRGHTIQRAELRRLLDNLNAMSRRRRLEVAGLSPDRVDIIVAGLCIAETVMKRLGVNTLSVHDRGIRDGLLLGMTHELFPEAAPAASEAPDRLGSARSFAEKCQYERLHSEHVTTMAMEIYDQLAAVLPSPPPALADPAQRELLQVASILHDVGYYINYSRHHKHSYHLIVHSDLPGFSHRELEIIANIARYHRRAHPKAKHEAFMQLEPPQRDAVQQLAAILRIADGLDRAHAGNVRHVTVEVDNATAYFTVDAEREPEVDLWGAARKSRLFYKVFGLEPRFLCSDHAGNATAHRVNDVDESVTVEGREG
jgi:exopolyphosphatase/guanosine-5'-triphosphate,3'-diphosphate pyrophosphatase